LSACSKTGRRPCHSLQHGSKVLPERLTPCLSYSYSILYLSALSSIKLEFILGIFGIFRALFQRGYVAPLFRAENKKTSYRLRVSILIILAVRPTAVILHWRIPPFLSSPDDSAHEPFGILLDVVDQIGVTNRIEVRLLLGLVSLAGFKVNGVGLNVVKRIVHKNSKKKVMFCPVED